MKQVFGNCVILVVASLRRTLLITFIRLDAGRMKQPAAGTSGSGAPPPIRPSAKQIGLFLSLSSTLRKQAGKADLIKAICLQKNKISFLSEEICSENLEEMREFYQRPELTSK